jgi:hypothetical protein
MQKSMRLLAAFSLLALTASPVLAERPAIEYLDLPSGFSFTLSGVCAFDVFEELLGNKEKIATFSDQNGDITFQLLTGVNKWRFTNVDTGKSIVINGSGPGRFLVQPGSDIVFAQTGGVSFWTFQPGTQPPGWPTLALTKGRIVAELDPTTFTIVNLIAQQGTTVEDLCAVLE